MSTLPPDFKQVLIISPEPWNGQFVSKHHYAITLAESGIQVYFLNPPKETCHNLEVNKTYYSNLWEVNSPQVVKGLRFYPKYIRNLIEKKWLNKLEAKVGKKFTTIWLFENSRFYDMNFAENRLKIYHQVDSNQNLHIKKAASTADICFCTTDFIKNKLKIFNKQVYKIHHGVSSSKSEKHLNKNQLSLLLKNQQNVVLIGNLDIKYLDVNLLESLITKHLHISFHLIGGFNEQGFCYSRCGKLKNALWWGKVDSEMIPVILSHCDVSLLLYKAETKFDIEQLASPHKVMEYLASGKVNVATYTDEYKDKRELLEMVDKNSDYISKFNDVINDLVHYNSVENQSMRKAFAKEHTYSKQLTKIFSYLKTNKLIN